MKKMQKKPHVICHMLGSVDGRIKQDIWGFNNPAKFFEQPAAKIKADAWLVGRVTMQEFCSKKQRPRRGVYSVPPGDFVAPVDAKTWCVAIDPAGKCRWDKNKVSTEYVIEVLTEAVTPEYLSHLREKDVSYIFAGKKTLDLDQALRKLRALFGIKTVRIDGGGHVNGSFMEAGLIDEFSLVLAPVADGTAENPSVFEAAEKFGKRRAMRLRLKSVQKIFKDFLWIRYAVEKKA